MRIGIDGRVLYRSEIKGVGRYLQHLLNHLISANGGHEYFLFYNPQDLAQNGLELPRSIVKIPISANSDELWEQWELPKAVRKNQLDIFHSPANTTSVLLGCKTIVTLHDAMSHRFAIRWGRRENFYWNYVQKWAYRKVSKFITPSFFAKCQIVDELSISEQKIKVIYHGISETYQKADLAAVNAWREKYGVKGPYIFIAGGRLERKNIPMAIQAFDIALEKIKPINLVISGVKGVKAVETIVEKIKNHHHICLLPHLHETDLISAYSGAEVFIFPSLEETFGFPPVEAMACGVPVIASNASCIPEVLGDGAYLVDCHQRGLLAEAITTVVNSPDLQRDLIRRGTERVTKYKWEFAAKKTLAVYDEVTNQ